VRIVTNIADLILKMVSSHGIQRHNFV